MPHWWQLNIVDGGKGPLLLAFCAFVVTFLITRTITRLIRAGKGPFTNVSAGGVHLHHSTPGLILLIIGAFTAVGAPTHSVWPYVAATLVGVGSSLVLDEFAMIFRLQNVYWTQEGQLSVNMVTLAGACIGLAVVGFSPARVPELSDRVITTRWAVAAALVVHFGLLAVTALKGKSATMLIGLFLAPVAWVGAVRLARPAPPGRAGSTATAKSPPPRAARSTSTSAGVRCAPDGTISSAAPPPRRPPAPRAEHRPHRPDPAQAIAASAASALSACTVMLTSDEMMPATRPSAVMAKVVRLMGRPASLSRPLRETP